MNEKYMLNNFPYSNTHWAYVRHLRRKQSDVGQARGVQHNNIQEFAINYSLEKNSLELLDIVRRSQNQKERIEKKEAKMISKKISGTQIYSRLWKQVFVRQIVSLLPALGTWFIPSLKTSSLYSFTTEIQLCKYILAYITARVVALVEGSNHSD